MTAMDWSSGEIMPTGLPSASTAKGLVTLLTWGEDSSVAASDSMTAALSSSRTVAPSSAWKTTLALAPSALISGNRSSSRSKASWDSVPGSTNSGLVSCWSVVAAAATPPTMRTQTARTSHRSRKEPLPRR